MGKHRRLMILLLIPALALGGCSKAETPAVSGPDGQTTTGSAVADGSEKPQGKEMGRPALFGQVKSIVGNEVVLLLAEMPKMEVKDGETAQKPAAITGGGSSGGPPMGGPPGMGGGNRSDLSFSGETQTVQIPVGVPIVQGSREEEKTLDIADIGAGDILRIWMDGDRITRVSVMSSGE